MASTTSSPSGFFSSPRNQQWLMWGSGAVLVVGLVVFLGVMLSRGGSTTPVSSPSTVSSPAPSKTSGGTNHVSVTPATSALQLARKFIETALPRTNYASMYDYVGPNVKGGLSRKQWNTGNIPVPVFHATNLATAKYTVKISNKNELLLEFDLHGAPGSGVKSLGYLVGVYRIHGKWLVNYIESDYTTPIQANPNN